MRDSIHLVADVGGSNTRLALSVGSVIRQDTVKRYENSTVACLEDILNSYVANLSFPSIDGICVAVAGPTQRDCAELTNINWAIHKTALQKISKTAKIGIINDMQAQAYAINALDYKDVVHLFGSKEINKQKPILVCGIGTGFNIALRIPTAHGVIVPPAEAGHTRLPVRNETEQKIVNHLVQKNGFAEVEEVISGRGIALVNEVLYPKSALSARDIIQSGQTHPEAGHVIDVLCGFTGSYLGDLALTTLPYGGIFLIGGLARALRSFINKNNFGLAFCDKGRFSEMNNSFGVHLIVDDFAALKGCLAYLMQA